MPEWNQIAAFLIPPLIGAFIGFVTNYVAIRMLFRPLSAWRILGIRVPLTPGIIPAKRAQLAHRLGMTVGNHLLTADEVLKALDRESFRQTIEATVREKLAATFQREFGSLESLVPPVYHERLQRLSEYAGEKFAEAVFRYVSNEDFGVHLRRFVGARLSEMYRIPVGEFFGQAQRNLFFDQLHTQLHVLLCSSEFRQAVSDFIDEKLDLLLKSERLLREIVPEEIQRMLESFINDEVPPLLEKAAELINEDDVRMQLTTKLGAMIEHSLESLTGFSGLMARFVNMRKVHEQIPAFLDQAGEELAARLRDESMRARIAAVIRERLDIIMHYSAVDLFKRFPESRVDQIRDQFRSRVLTMAASESLIHAACSGLSNAANRLEGVTIGKLMNSVLSEAAQDGIHDYLTGLMLSGLRSEEMKTVLRTTAQDTLKDWISSLPLGSFGRHAGEQAQREISQVAYTQLMEILRREAAFLVESLDIEKMVEENVNSLDILEVESILLTIMKEHLWYINLFGGLLGFLIGLLNVLVR